MEIQGEITSTANPRIKEALKLRDRRERDRQELFLIEGYREILRATEAKQELSFLFFCPDFFLGTNERALIEKIAKRGAEIFLCSSKVFEKLSYRDRPDGLLAIAPIQRKGLDALEELLSSSRNPLVVVAESIEKPGNLGSILRSSDGVGADCVVVCDPKTDIYNPNVVRASVGTLFSLLVIESEGKETCALLKKHGLRIVAATPHAKAEFTEADLSGPLALIVGTEQLGLSEEWMKNADFQVRIPMKGSADSLNVATATTLLLYEVQRQRKLKERK